MLQPSVKALVGAVGLFNYGASQVCATLQHVDDILAFPATAPDHDQFRCRAPQLLNQTPPDVQDEPVILAGLDCAEHHEVGGLNWALMRRLRFDA